MSIYVFKQLTKAYMAKTSCNQLLLIDYSAKFVFVSEHQDPFARREWVEHAHACDVR